MKKINWSILIGLLTIVSLNAQELVSKKDSIQPKNIFKIFPLAALTGDIGLGYERVIKPKTSLNVILFQQFNEPNFDNNSIIERNYSLFFVTDLRRYLSKQKKAPEGWFISGGLLTEYNNGRFKNKTTNKITDVERLWIGASTKTGYQWVFSNGLKGFTTEVSGGIGYRTTSGVFDGGSLHELNINVHFTIGYSW